jgi:DeoR family myo-inositol catabolism operon transcriptional repressor
VRVDRLNEMEEYILSEGTVPLEKLAARFDVSTNTVRRDVNELIKRGRIRKVYGGVSAITEHDTNLTPVPLQVRAVEHSTAKNIIGRLAAGMVSDGDTIFLDSGTTVACMVPYLAEKEDVTIVTHSLNVMYEAAKYPSLNIIALGGYYNHATSSYSGISTLDPLSSISTNAAFIAATGVSLEKGLTHTTYFEAETKKKVVQTSSRVILCADDSKFGRASTLSFYQFEDLYAVVTNKMPDKKFLDAISYNNILLVCP